MTQYHAESKDDGDLSGFFLNQPHPQTTNRTRSISPQNDDGDLSGFLVNQPRPNAKSVERNPIIRNNDDDDLSGCLSSGFLGKQSRTIPKQPDKETVTRKSTADFPELSVGKSPIAHHLVTKVEDEDLSGCLSSGLLVESHADRLRRAHAQNLNQQLQTTAKSLDRTSVNYNDDLSGCLAAGVLKPSQTVVKPAQDPAHVAPVKVKQVEPDDDPNSGWLYFH